MSSMHNWNVETTPFVNTNAVSDSLSSHCQHCWIVTDKDNSPSRRKSCLYHTNYIGNGETREERPHGEVLESSRRGRELVAKSIVLHVNADKVIESGSWETENARNLLGMEEICGFVPVNPHTSQIIA